MASRIGNVWALVFIVMSALVGLVSLEASTILFVIIAYTIWLIIMLTNLFSKPSKSTPFCQLLCPNEIEVYRRYYIYFGFSGAAEASSALMNGLRMAGFVWGGLCLWSELYWLGGISIAYFFITGGLILKLNPWLYMGAEAKKGNQVAIGQLTLIETIQTKRDAFFKASE